MWVSVILQLAFVENWEKFLQTLLIRYQLKLESLTCNCRRMWLIWIHIIHERGSMAKCLGVVPPATSGLSHPILISDHVSSMTFALHPDHCYCPLCLPHSLGFGILHVLAVPSGMSFSTPPSSLYSPPIWDVSLSTPIPSYLLFLYSQSQLLLCLIVNGWVMHLLQTKPWAWCLVWILPLALPGPTLQSSPRRGTQLIFVNWSNYS